MNTEDWNSQIIFMATVVAMGLVALRQSGWRVRLLAHPLFLMAGILLYVTTGPWLDLVLNGQMPLRMPPAAGFAAPTYVHLLCLLGFAAGYLIWGEHFRGMRQLQPERFARRPVLEVPPRAYGYMIVIAIGSLIAYMSPYILNPSLLGGIKGQVGQYLSPLMVAIFTAGLVGVIISWCLIIALRDAMGLRPLDWKVGLLFLAYVLLSMMISEREFLYPLMALFITWSRQRQAKGWQLGAFFICLVLGMLLPGLARKGGMAPSKQVETLSNVQVQKGSLSHDFLGGLNDTLAMTAWTVLIVPSHDSFRYGKTYLTALPTCCLWSSTGRRAWKLRLAGSTTTGLPRMAWAAGTSVRRRRDTSISGILGPSVSSS